MELKVLKTARWASLSSLLCVLRVVVVQLYVIPTGARQEGVPGRIFAVEGELRKAEPNVSKEAFKEIKRVWAWCSSVLLACILIGESGLGFLLSVAYLFGCLK